MTTQASFTYWKPIACETKKKTIDDDYDGDDVETEKKKKSKIPKQRKQKVLKTKKGHREQST